MDEWRLAMRYLLTSCFKISSGTFLEELQMAKADEWEKMTGALLALKASLMVALAVWLRSINIPSLFISWTTAFPNAVRPPPKANENFTLSLSLLTCWNIYSPDREKLGMFTNVRKHIELKLKLNSISQHIAVIF